MQTYIDYEPTNREASQERERDKMQKSGANLATIYKNALGKRLRRQKAKQAAEARRKRE